MENTDMGTRTYRVHYPNGKVIDVTLPVELLYQLETAVSKVSRAMHPDASYITVGIPTNWTVLARIFSLHPDVASGPPRAIAYDVRRAKRSRRTNGIYIPFIRRNATYVSVGIYTRHPLLMLDRQGRQYHGRNARPWLSFLQRFKDSNNGTIDRISGVISVKTVHILSANYVDVIIFEGKCKKSNSPLF